MYLVSGRVPPHALGLVPLRASGRLVVVEAELAHEEAGHPGRVARVWGLVPHLHHVFTHHHVSGIKANHMTIKYAFLTDFIKGRGSQFDSIYYYFKVVPSQFGPILSVFY